MSVRTGVMMFLGLCDTMVSLKPSPQELRSETPVDPGPRYLGGSDTRHSFHAAMDT